MEKNIVNSEHVCLCGNELCCMGKGNCACCRRHAAAEQQGGEDRETVTEKYVSGRNRIKAKAIFLWFFILLAGFAGVDRIEAHEGPGNKHDRALETKHTGLLLLAHGAPMEPWNKPVRELSDKVRELNTGKQLHAIEIAFLEFAQPDAFQGIRNLEQAGCDRIVAMPLFIAPSSHSHFDVPAVLGLYSSPSIRTVLKEENARIASPKVPVTVLQTLSESDVLEQYALSELERLSDDPANEALILLAHGCPDHARLIQRKLNKVMTYCIGKKGISYAEWACCGMGQEYGDAISAYSRALEQRKKAIVIGLYLSSSALSIHKRGARQYVKDFPLDEKLVFSDRGVITYPGLAGWIMAEAKSYITDAD